jgi:hypothetical protein
VYSSIFILLAHPLSPPLLYSIPLFASFDSPIYLIGDPSSFARGVNVLTLSSLVSYQLFSPCGLTYPKGTPQIKLHIYIDEINNISVPSGTGRANSNRVCNLRPRSVGLCSRHLYSPSSTGPPQVEAMPIRNLQASSTCLDAMVAAWISGSNWGPDSYPRFCQVLILNSRSYLN